MDSVPALIAYIDDSTRFRLANRKYTEWHGIKSDEIIGKRMRTVLGAKNFRAVKPYVEQALAGTECTFETTLQYRIAGNRFVQISYVPDVSDDGVVNGMFILVNDLTDRKRAEDLLRSNEERLRSLMESFPDYAIFSMDVEGRIESWNTGGEATFGYTADEMIGKSWEVVFTSEDVAKSVPLKEMRNARKNGRAMDDLWHVRKDGSLFFASGETTPLYIGKSLVGYAKIARDLTERRRYAEVLQEARNELEQRVANRTRQLAEANLLLLQQMDERANAERQRFQMLRKIFTIQEDERGRIARDIHDQLGQRLTALRFKIASLRDFAAADGLIAERVDRLQEIAEKLDGEVSFLAWELRPSILDDLEFVEALENYVSEWSRHSDITADFQAIGLKGVGLDRDIEANLYRITQEALNNASKHSQADQVNVLLEKRDGDLILIIEDNGVGFEPVEPTSERKLSESFGLVSMRERSALVSGTLDIESTAGSGTTIFVRVPLAQDTDN
jgi:PAS domain S-box-containing protein